MDKFEQIRKKIAEMETKSLVAGEMKAFITLVLSVVNKSKEELSNLSQENIKVIKDSIAYIEAFHEKQVKLLDGKINTATGQFDTKLALLKALIAKVQTIKPIDGIDGQDGLDGTNGKDGKDGSPDTRKEIVEKINTGDKKDIKIELKQIEGTDKLSDSILNRAIGIVDQRTSFLINKVSNLQTQVDNGGLGGASTLAEVSAGSLTTPNSLYTMTSTIPVEFKSSDGNSLLYLDETNEMVGIGGAPTSKLNVIETATTSPRGILSSQFSTGTDGARVGFSKARGTPTVPTTVVSGDTLGRLMFRGYDGTAYQEMASIEVSVAASVASTKVPTFMAFSTATNTTPSVLTERIRIIQDGNVGIGTSTPNTSGISGNSRVVTIRGTDTTSGIGVLELANGANQAGAGANLGIITGYNGADDVASIKFQNSSTDTGNILMATQTTGGVITDRWRFQHNGHLMAIADNTYDIGASAATRPRTLYLGTGATIPALTATTINGNTITTGTGVLTLGAGKTLTVSNSITLAGTDATTMTFPSTSATIARADGALTQFVGNGNWKVWYSDGSGDVTELALGASGTVLTSGGASSAPSFAAVGGGTPTLKISTTFEDAARFSKNVTGSGSGSVGGNGYNLFASATAGGSVELDWIICNSATAALYNGSPLFSCIVNANEIAAASGAGQAYFGLGSVTVAGTGLTFTDAHIGFKVVKTAGTATLYATQASAGAETASSALTTIVDGDILDLILKVNSTTSVDYYYRKNGGALSSATNLTTNLPTAGENSVQFATSNVSSNFEFGWRLGGASYER